MQKTYITIQFYEEDKAIIHKMNQQLLCSLSLWKQQDMYNSKKLYHLHLI
jgi:hypothetical protein